MIYLQQIKNAIILLKYFRSTYVNNTCRFSLQSYFIYINQLHKHTQQQKTCPVEKYALDGDGVIEYHSSLPKLEQFTLCAWMRFTNHSGDHTIFTYSGEFKTFYEFYI